MTEEFINAAKHLMEVPMPHDKNGRLVEVGDWVKGKPYNTPRPIVGVILNIKPGIDACNAEVAFLTQYEGVKKDYWETGAMDLVMKADGGEPEQADYTKSKQPAMAAL